MSNSSYKIPFNKLRKNKDVIQRAVVLIKGEFWKIKNIYDHEFYAKKSVNDFRGLLIHLHPYGKTGTIKQNLDGEVPFYIYDSKRVRRDIPKELLKGTEYNKVETGTYLGLEKANLVGHIVQTSPNSKDGGFVVYDFGNEVLVRLKSGSDKRYDKQYLHFNKTHYSKKKYKVLWFVYEDSNPIPTSKADQKLKLDKKPYNEYIELQSNLNPTAEYSDGYGTWSKNNIKLKRMRYLWGLLTPSEKLRIEKKNK